MNTLPFPGREDDDPTGVRNLLAGLSDPGPMPDALADRIRLALAAEQAQRATPTAPVRTVTADEDEARTTAPVRTLRPAEDKSTTTSPVRTLRSAADTSRAEGSTAEARPWGAGDELAARRARRNRVATWVAGAAAAAALVTGAIIASGMASGPDVVAEPRSVEATEGATGMGQVKVVASGHEYTATSLASDSKQLRDGALTTDQNALAGRSDAKAAQQNPLAVSPCVKGLMKDLMARPDSVVVDFATFEGKEAMIIVVERDGKSTAWAVDAGCSVASPGVLAGPEAVES